jgi:hypothetical protein
MFSYEIDKKELWKPPNTTKMKILQARFDCACSWAVMEMHITANAA